MSAATGARAPQAALALFAIASLVALSHLANDWMQVGDPAGLAWKAAGIVLLGVFAAISGAWLAALGLFLCAAGDVLLEIDGLFVGGMAAFALGHVCYAAIFINLIRSHGMNKRDQPVAVLVVLIVAGLSAWLIPGMGDLLIPSLIYMAVILTMAVSALLSKASMAARMGALLFVVSDSILAAGLYRDAHAFPGAVWLTYALAQILLAWGFVKLHQALQRRKR
jgi:uncharacterized membrane protein YhhN